jgi:hypothetical protein
LGIVDRIAGKNDKGSWGKDYAIYYSCEDGTISPKNLGVKGQKVKNGEIMEVLVDLPKGKV